MYHDLFAVFVDCFFIEMLLIWDAFFKHFWIVFEWHSRNSDFTKMSVSCRREHHFQGFQGTEIDQRSMEKRFRKQHRSMDWCLIDYALILRAFLLPNWSKNHVRIDIEFWSNFGWLWGGWPGTVGGVRRSPGIPFHGIPNRRFLKSACFWGQEGSNGGVCKFLRTGTEDRRDPYCFSDTPLGRWPGEFWKTQLLAGLFGEAI